MYTPYVRISSGNPYTVLDATALNPPGTLYSPPIPQNVPATTKGLGAQPVMKYLLYKSTTNPTVVAAPAPVYYTDETFTTVSGNAAEAFVTTAGVSIAGYLLPNSTSISTLTNTLLNSSYVWVQIGGLLVGAWGPTSGGGVGNAIIGATSGNFVSTGSATPANARVFGAQLTAVASSVCDVLVGPLGTFWGS